MRRITIFYYKIHNYKDKFDTLFGNLAIGKNPTLLHNTYLVLRMQFAGIDVDTDKATFNGFRANVMTGIIKCMGVYSDYFSKEDMAEIKATDTPANMIQLFFNLYEIRNIPHPIYILIDEYDQFANELVALDTDR
jgi:hypothetical protein